MKNPMHSTVRMSHGLVRRSGTGDSGATGGLDVPLAVMAISMRVYVDYLQ